MLPAWLYLATLFAAGWFCCRCTGTYDPPPCTKCTDDNDHVAVKPISVGNGYCVCNTYFNTTWICARQSGNACKWARAVSFTPPLAPCGTYGSYAVWAEVMEVALGGKIGWKAGISFSGYIDGSLRSGYIRWIWNSGASSDIDCTATQTLGYELHYDPADIYGAFSMCSGHSSTTCQVN